jgi:hypothetical protein
MDGVLDLVDDRLGLRSEVSSVERGVVGGEELLDLVQDQGDGVLELGDDGGDFGDDGLGFSENGIKGGGEVGVVDLVQVEVVDLLEEGLDRG